MIRIPTDEQKIVAEYMAKYPKLRGSALAQVIHGDGELMSVSDAALCQRVNKIQGERIKSALADTGTDGEQIAITGTISREELEALEIKAKKYEYLVRAMFAGARESEKFQGVLYLDYRVVNELLRALEPEAYDRTIERTRRNK